MLGTFLRSSKKSNFKTKKKHVIVAYRGDNTASQHASYRVFQVVLLSRDGFGMGFFRDPDPDPEISGIFKIPIPGIFFPKIPKCRGLG